MLKFIIDHKAYEVFILICAILALTFFVMAGKTYIEKPAAALTTIEFEKQKWFLSQTMEKVRSVEFKIDDLYRKQAAMKESMTDLLVESKYQSKLLGRRLAAMSTIVAGTAAFIGKNLLTKKEEA